MMLKRFRSLAGLACLMLASASLAGSDRPPLEEMPQQFQLAFWLNQAALAYDENDYADWARATEKLHALRPYNQDFMTHLVTAYARTGDTSKAFNMMLTMQQQGLAQDWEEIEGLDDLRQHRLYNHLNDLMIEAGRPFGQARLFAELGPEHAMPEALAHDPESGRLFVGTVRDGRILQTVDGKEWKEFATPATVDGLRAVFDLAVDSERGHLWVATGSVSHFQAAKPGQRGTALLKLDLESGELIKAYPVKADGQPHMLGSIVVNGDGVVFAADAGVPVMFRLDPEEHDHPRPFFGHENFASLRGIALSDDDKRLYVVDYEIGILVLSVDDSQRAWKLAVPETLNEGGIDGIHYWNDHLIVIQNGVTPQRVLKLELGPDGLGVVSVSPVVAGLEEFDVPTFGTMVENDLVFLAASHWQKVDHRGQPRDGVLPAIPIMRTDVDATEVQVVGQDVLDRMRDQIQNQ
jgi:sugar lactone lactonase YvrE